MHNLELDLELPERDWEEHRNLLFSDPRHTIKTSNLIDHFPIHSKEQANSVLLNWKNEAKTKNVNCSKTILSLFDESGVWSAPYVLAGYDVIQFDIQNGVDISELTNHIMHSACIDEVYGILAAVPCTHFANSGARWFKEKDESGVTTEAIDLTHIVLELVNYYLPEFWALENPMGRIQRLCDLPKARMFFEPHHFGDPYTKKTQLFGYFNTSLPFCNVEPTLGSYIHKLSGNFAKHKKLRSVTPEGFAYSFFIANQ